MLEIHNISAEQVLNGILTDITFHWRINNRAINYKRQSTVIHNITFSSEKDFMFLYSYNKDETILPTPAHISLHMSYTQQLFFTTNTNHKNFLISENKNLA